MGTNYYMMTTDKQFVKENFINEYELTDEPYLAYEIHMCKCSMGWKTSFRSHPMAYTSVKHMVEFLKSNRDRFKIYDEYSEEQDLDEFIDYIVNRDKNSPKHRYIWKRSEFSDLTICDDAEEDYIETPFDHIEYFEFERKHNPYTNTYYQDEYYNDDEGYNFIDCDFS